MPTPFRNFVKRSALSLIYRLPPLPQRFHGQLVWVHPRARFSLSTKTFFKGERHVQQWLTERLSPGCVFFDVGAHHGWVSMWTLPLVGMKGAVYSFEPSPANLSVLEWHRSHNNLSQWVIVPQAVADQDSEHTGFFLIDSGDSPMNSLTTGVPGTALMDGRDISQTTVPTTTLDSFCKQIGARPNLVKIDVEGAELLVLRGATRLLSDACPPIILAVHPYWLPAGQSPAQIAELLKAFGYSIFDSGGERVEALRSGEYLCLNPQSGRTIVQ